MHGASRSGASQSGAERRAVLAAAARRHAEALPGWDEGGCIARRSTGRTLPTGRAGTARSAGARAGERDLRPRLAGAPRARRPPLPRGGRGVAAGDGLAPARLVARGRSRERHGIEPALPRAAAARSAALDAGRSGCRSSGAGIGAGRRATPHMRHGGSGRLGVGRGGGERRARRDRFGAAGPGVSEVAGAADRRVCQGGVRRALRAHLRRQRAVARGDRTIRGRTTISTTDGSGGR